MESVCNLSDLEDNCPKEVAIDGEKILLIRQQDSVYAIGPKCSHYGMPLSKGVVYQNKIRCPYHGACFSLKTGDIEDFPGIDCIPSFRVVVEGTEVKVSREDVKQKTAALKASGDQLSCSLSLGNTDSKKRVVAVGGGIASFQFCYTLRQRGFSGSITLLTEEDSPPYDRTKLSKAMSSTASDLLLKPNSFYENLGIQVLAECRVTRVDSVEKLVVTKDAKEFPFDYLFLASGLKPRNIQVPGSKLPNIFYVRSYKDANRISEAAVGKSVVVLGSSFIAMEAATFLKNKGTSVTVVARSAVPFANILGNEVGRRIKALFESKGISFRMNSQVHHFEGDEQGIKSIHLMNGEVLPAEVCVVGLGTEADSEFLNTTGIELDPQGYVVVDSRMKTSQDNIYAGGDMVSFPLEEERLTVGHWQMAQSQGRVAALNLLGIESQLKSIPFFWSMFFGKGLRYAGHTDNVIDPLITGDLENFKFVAYYFSKGRVAAVASIGQDEVPSMFASLRKDGYHLLEEDIKRNSNEWISAFKDGPQVTRI